MRTIHPCVLWLVATMSVAPIRAGGAEVGPEARKARTTAEGTDQPAVRYSRGSSASPAFVSIAWTQDTTKVRRDSTARGDSAAAQDSALHVNLSGRFETRAERNKNDRCFATQLFNSNFTCRSTIAPRLDFQFNLVSQGTVADRIHVDVDYDSQREFDGSNNISLFYDGKPGQFLQRVDVGNVSFAPPPSRFLTSGIPSGNYGVQARAQRGIMTMSVIAAQQKGNVVKDQVFTVGATTSQRVERDIEDWQVEPRRFFFTVDPQAFGAAWPNVDILDARQLSQLAAALPDTLRPSRVFLYRLIIGGQPPNPNGPRFRLIGDPLSRPGQAYELLRENVDYYLDPSQLWFALVRPLSLANERLVVAYTMRIGGRDTTIASVGGTPDLEFIPGRTQLANLVWDPQVTPQDAAFRREIRSVYRLGGEDLRRETVDVRIVTGTGPDQEKPPGGAAATYLQLFGVAQPTSPSAFDAENRLWPRPNDPNLAISGAPGAAVIRDRFLVFPSLQPFARNGLAHSPAVPANDTLYRTPSEYLYSVQHPQSFYRLRTRYEVTGSAGTGTLALAAVQLRAGSERITLDGLPLTRGVDYEIDYDLGRVTLLRPDSLSGRAKRVVVRYEENPLFASVPTSVYGLTSQWVLPHGSIAFTAISQSQRTTFTRPPVGFEPQGSLVAGVIAAYGWNVPSLGRLLQRLGPAGDSSARASPRLDVRAELAVSQPRQRGSQQAYLESFEGDGGVSVPLFDAQWQYSSQPSLGSVLPGRLGASTLDTSRASTLAFQGNATDRTGRAIVFRITDIDTLVSLTGTGFAPPEQALWLTLYPLSIGGQRDPSTGQYRWTVPRAPTGRRWRSVRAALGSGGSGVDLSRAELLEFWTLADTAGIRRGRNPTLVVDLGDVSENSVLLAPDTIRIAGGDSTFIGRQLAGFDTLNTERDPFSRAFSAEANDLGLPGDLVDSIVVAGPGGMSLERKVRLCVSSGGVAQRLGDVRADCTVRNSRLDEEDIDQDATLNYPSALREQEKIRRYIVDLSDTASWSRTGKCGVSVNDINQSLPPSPTRCWVLVRRPFLAPDDSVNGGPLLRRVRAVRVTIVSGRSTPDADFVTLPIARLRLTGSTWLKRAPRPLHGIAGEEQATGGYVVASVIGTQDRDSLRGLVYEPPPGVTDAPEQQQVFGTTLVQINERSLRLLAGGLARAERAEAYMRFVEGEKSVMSYREMRLWARGRGRGWGAQGDLQFFVKLGRDANNFYAYRTPISSGPGREQWEPELRVKFQRFFELRARLQNAWLQGRHDASGCNAADSALINASGLPPTTRVDRFVACEDGYMVYTIDPAVGPPNQAAGEGQAVGIVRVDSLRGSDPPQMGDTLEVWVDDIRLADVVNTAGYAAEVGATLDAGDYGSLRLTTTRRDPNFRQLADQPTFVGGSDLEIAGTLRLDKVLPNNLGLAIPLTIQHVASGADPLFLTRSDIQGSSVSDLRTPNVSITTYTLGVRRKTPTGGEWYAPILDHTGLSATWTHNGNRSEFQRGRANDLHVGLDFFNAIAEAPPAGAGSMLRLQPTTARVTSSVERGIDRRESFLKPASAFDDTARVVSGETYYWRTGTSFEFQPLAGVQARWDATSVRDMRRYDGATPNAIAAANERGTLAGLDVGLERERRLLTTISYAPLPQGWLRPRLELGTSYTMLRDPNNPAIATGSSLADFPRLQRRFGNSQRVAAFAALDLSGVARAIAGDSSFLQRAVSMFRPFDIAVSRDLLSAFDGAPIAPSSGFQFGWGDVGSFRSQQGVLAASAGSSTQLSVGNTIALPFGASVTGRVQHGESRQWSRRSTDRQERVEGAQDIYPDVTLRWSGTPGPFNLLFSSLSTSARLLRSRQAFVAPATLASGFPELRASRLISWPLSFSAMTARGEVSMSAAIARSTRVDSLPGSVGNAATSDLTADIGRAFPLPASWQLKSKLRTRMSYQRTETRSYVSNLAAAGARSRLTDNGRHAFSLNADSDVADNMTLSLQGSRVVTFDRNFNRRFNQMVLSAVLQVQFFGGALR